VKIHKFHAFREKKEVLSVWNRGGNLFQRVGCPRVGATCELGGFKQFSKFMIVQMQFWAYFYAYMNI